MIKAGSSRRPFYLNIYVLTLFFSLSSCSINSIDNNEIQKAIYSPFSTTLTHKLSVKEFIDSPINESLLDNNKWEVDTNSYYSSYTKKYIYKNSLIKTSEGCFFSSIIADRDIMLSNDIHIGLSKKEFEAKFTNLTNNKQSPFIENTPTHIRFGENQLKNDCWNFEFNNDTLVLITYLSK